MNSVKTIKNSWKIIPVNEIELRFTAFEQAQTFEKKFKSQLIRSVYKNIFEGNKKKKNEKQVKKVFSFTNIPSANLPQVTKFRNEINQISSKATILPMIKKPSKPKIATMIVSSPMQNDSSEKIFTIEKPHPAYFSFPKKNFTTIKHQKRKSKRDLSVSSWGTENNNILWTLPQIQE